MNNSKISNLYSGFTLLESLVALAVVAIAMAALWKGLLQGQHISTALPDRVIARWVAQNHLVTRQVMREWPQARTYSGVENMAGRDWYWEEIITTTTVADMRRVTVNVGRRDQEVIYTLEGYLHRSEPPPAYERLFR